MSQQHLIALLCALFGGSFLILAFVLLASWIAVRGRGLKRPTDEEGDSKRLETELRGLVDNYPDAILENLADLRHTHAGSKVIAAIEAYLETDSSMIARRAVLELVAPLYDEYPDHVSLKKTVRGWDELRQGERGPEAQRLVEAIERVSSFRVAVWKRIDFLRDTLVGSAKGLGERLGEIVQKAPSPGTAASEALMSEIDRKLIELCAELGRRLPAKRETAKPARKKKLNDSLSWLRKDWIPGWEQIGRTPGLGAVERDLSHRVVQAVWKKLSDFSEKSGGLHAVWPGTLEQTADGEALREGRFSWARIGSLIVLFSASLSMFTFAAASRWGLFRSFDVDVAAASTVLVVTPRSEGSGFLVEGGRFVITNQHVVDSFDRVLIHLKRNNNEREEGRPIEANVLASDKAEDLAILGVQDANTIDGLPRGLVMSAQPTVRSGDEVHILGNPLGMRDIYVRGTVMKVDVEQYHMLMDAKIAPGNSGGPVCNARGEVIGVTTAYVKPKSQTSFDYGVAVLSDRAWLLLKSVRGTRSTER